VPCVTVVIPAWNRASLLEQTLRSVDQQTHPSFEVIVADDGSTDETAGVVPVHGATRLHNASGDWGAAGARNAGLRVARGDLVAFVDSDDLLLPTISGCFSPGAGGPMGVAATVRVPWATIAPARAGCHRGSPAHRPGRGAGGRAGRPQRVSVDTARRG
jgi:hypothetical protein